MRSIFNQLKEKDRGSALAFVAGALVLLMGMVAFGTDLAWFYLNSSRVQRGADAAALAGVVHLPQDEPTAFSTALDVAAQNTYDDSDPETTVIPTRVSANQLGVEIRETVPTFFLRVFGIDTQVITEEATAEYIPPLKLGSPANKFGNDPSCYVSNPDCAGNFWANIHGSRTDTGYGDAYSSYCALGDQSSGCAQSPQHRETGYLYGVIPGGNSVTIETLDLTFHYDPPGSPDNGDHHRTGDHNNFCGEFSAPDTCTGPTLTVNVYRPDPTPLDISDNTLHCSETYPPAPQFDPHADPDEASEWDYWDSVCGGSINTSSAPDGIWVVQIVTNDLDSDGFTDSPGDEDVSGLNRYSIRTNTGNIFALGDFSIFNNASGTTTSFYLAEVPDFYAGKTFVVEMYDTGESDDPGELQPIDPFGDIFDDGECRIYSRSITGNWSLDTTISSGTDCIETVSPKEYHGEWLKIEMDLPASYTCSADCWWRMNYAYSSDLEDTTTWRAYIIGNPIHLVP